MLTMAAVTDACDIFKLINDGYVVDVLPCKGVLIARCQFGRGSFSVCIVCFRQRGTEPRGPGAE